MSSIVHNRSILHVLAPTFIPATYTQFFTNALDPIVPCHQSQGAWHSRWRQWWTLSTLRGCRLFWQSIGHNLRLRCLCEVSRDSGRTAHCFCTGSGVHKCVCGIPHRHWVCVGGHSIMLTHSHSGRWTAEACMFVSHLVSVERLCYLC